MSSHGHQFAATSANFMTEVVEASRTTPVVVDFWADWCAPCRQLMPVLERLVAEYAGRFRLAKVNTDEEQAIAAQLGIRSLPTVVLFKDGAPVDHFMGALPESQVRDFLDRHVNTAQSDTLTEIRSHRTRGDFAGAKALLEVELASRPEDPEVLGQLGEIEALLDDMSAARSRLEALQATEPQHAATRRLEALIAFRDVVTVHPDPHALQERLVRNAGDLEARHALAVHHLMAGRHQQAIDDLLAVLRQNAAHDDGRARASLLRAFDLIGSDDPLVGAARRELAKLLF
jgi:putative thioredoxin